MRNATNPGQLAEVDLDRVRDLLGDDAARSLQQLAELARMLEEAGLIEQREGRMELTPEGHPPHRPARARRPVQATARRTAPGGTRSNAPASVTSAPTITRPTSSAIRCISTSARTIKNAITRAGRRHAGAHHARGLRDRAHRAGHPQRDRADARRLALDGDARPVPRGEEGRDGAARADHARSSRATTSEW